MAQECLYKYFYADMFRICQRYATHPHEALTILNDAFLKVFRSIHQYREEKGKMNAWVKTIVINTAIEKLNATGSHGLQPVGEIRLSEDLLLRKALAFAAAHAGKLPTQNDGEVEGFPGQTWGMWSQAIRNKSNGLTRNGLTGIGSLFRACGLKTGRIENSEPVKQAWERLQNEGHHGLTIGGDPIVAATRPNSAGANIPKAEPSV